METLRWMTTNEHQDNNETMQDYLQNYLPSCFDIILEDGTYSEIKNRNTDKVFAVHASGDGDFNNHKVEFEFIQ